MGLLSKLFPKKSSAGSSKPTKGEDVVALITAYGGVLQAHSAAGSVVSDVDRLPASKDTMRAAILTVIHATDDETLREQLEGAYVMLAEFQPGVGSRVVKIDTDIGATADIKESALRVAAQGEEFSRWNAQIALEAQRLLQDVQEFRAKRASKTALA